ncbi:MAG: IS1380 family transposase [Isosphaeraceae bacterium]
MMTECRAKSHCKATRQRRRHSNGQAQHPQKRLVDLPSSDSSYLDFPLLGSRQVLASFDGGDISSDGGSLLLRKTEELTGIIRQFAACFTDHRNPQLIEHSLEHLVAQRVYALALGYEDLNDHDDLRHDPLLATVVGKKDPTGQDRLRKRDKGKALAGKSTLNRLELTPVGADEDSRYKKIICGTRAVEGLFVELFLQAHPVPPEQIVLDLDATNDPIHGDQLGRFFHGHYQEYCFLPLYIFCGDHLLCARLRPSDIDGSAGALKQLQRIIARIRQVWPKVKILVRGDSGFCREPTMAWCEANDVDYVFGLAQNPRLLRLIAEPLEQARRQFEATKQPTRVFADLQYKTLDSWSRERRVVAKAEHLEKGANPRFVVTSFGLEEHPAKELYEETYCSRGEMENRIKEQQLHLFADRTSAETMRANQIRLFFSSIAYTLLETLRRLGLTETSMAQAQCQTIRLRLLKIGALVQATVRKVWVRLASSCPSADVFRQAFTNLDRLRPVMLRC